ncbi:single-stranded DNA-binding protein [Arcicella sp. LKC2W]|uniref:single-stranded DNA-binding protein n=1 Tax=Arcicella sp. LKC2W TaxID=2984198 RepID=UPI002B1F6819|nr:single-stranded DNA-binding protein [Arcicella sp. LKC2W]MEA5461111.1 single-stranded DNA-binding protein [Arcicella sp. LKC2W]
MHIKVHSLLRDFMFDRLINQKIIYPMRGLNKVTLIGNLGNNPIIQNLEGNVKVAKFSLATSEHYKDANGQNQTITDWHNIVLWRALADLAEKYLHKGSLIYLEGKLKTRTYDDKDGQKKYVSEIVAENILLLDKKATDGN